MNPHKKPAKYVHIKGSGVYHVDEGDTATCIDWWGAHTTDIAICGTLLQADYKRYTTRPKNLRMCKRCRKLTER